MNHRIVITDNGVYATRGGRLAFISGTERDLKTGQFQYKGYTLVLKGKITSPRWHLWSPDGRWNMRDEHENDVVARI